MDNEKFIKFKPLVSQFNPQLLNEDNEIERMKQYYKENNLTPNSYLADYIGFKEEEMYNQNLERVLPINKAADVKNIIERLREKQLKDEPRELTYSEDANTRVKEFNAFTAPLAEQGSKATGIPKELFQAIAALETGYGKSVKGNNYGGIKAWKKGNTQSFMTKEHENGRFVSREEEFQAYNTPEEGFIGIIEFLNKNPRYSKLKTAKTAEEAADILAKAGYATDPDYAAKLKSVIKRLRKTE